MKDPGKERDLSEHSKKRVIGIDLGDIKSHLCMLDEATGEILEERIVATEKEAVFAYFTALEKSTVILELGPHSPWLSRFIEGLGHEVMVANARELRLIYKSKRKNDRVDAEKLARLARLERSLVCQVSHRSEQQQADLGGVRARARLVKVRQQLVNHVRAVLKAFGIKSPKVYPAGFHRKVRLCMPKELEPALLPIIETLKALAKQIQVLAKRILLLAEEHYPETALLKQVKGVGSLIALTFVLTLADPSRFDKRRKVGAYLGLVPGQDPSGEHDPKQPISKEGDALLRRYLVRRANDIIGPLGEDCDLKRFASVRLEQRGKSARKQLLSAVARKLSILLHHLWRTGEVYQPLFNSQNKVAKEVELVAA